MMNSATFSIENPNGNSDWLFICEHAGNYVPANLKQLGLSDRELEKHIAYDIGAEAITRYLAEQLNATAVIGKVSRLVIDCNRPLSHTECIPTISDGVQIPGNQHLTAEQRAWRINNIYRPFHTAVFDTLCEKLAQNPQLKIANIHSFTPMLAETGQPRPWDIGFIHRNHALTRDVMAYFQNCTDYCIGDNEPYNGFIHKGYTIPTHADAMEVPALLVEFRQDLINHVMGVKHWSHVLLTAIQSIEQNETV